MEIHTTMQIIKRDGREVDFNIIKIKDAIKLAMSRTELGIDEELAVKIAESIEKTEKSLLSVEDIQDLVEKKLMASSRKDVAKEYITYRQRRSEERLRQSDLYRMGQDIIDVLDQDLVKDNANLNGESFSGKMSRFGSEYSKWYVKNFGLPVKLKKAIENNYVYVHDLDQFILGTTNCIFVPLGKLLKNGFSTGNGSVRPPNSIMTAMALVAIIFQSQQNSQYGGVGANMIDHDLAPYVDKSFKKHFKNGIKYVEEFDYNDFDETDMFMGSSIKNLLPKAYDYAYEMTIKETYQSAESLIHNLNTMSSRAGGQIPFTSINYGTCTSVEGRIVINALLEATIKGLGHGETPIFPIQIFKCKKGINQNSRDINYDLFVKAIECSSKRLFPNFVNIDAPYNLKYYDGENPDTEIASMGCRTRILADRFGKNYCSGKGNVSFNTVNLVKLGIENGICLNKRDVANVYDFFKELNKSLTVALDGLIYRFKLQGKQKAKCSDFMMREGIWENGDKLNPNDNVEELLKHGSLSIGFIGLAECMKAMYGKHHGEDNDIWDKAYNVIKYMRNFCDEKSEEYNLNISLFATPAEGLSGKFTKIDKKDFGEIVGVTDRIYYTNSFHIPVYYDITAFDKINLEAPFHELCNAGAIGYIELNGNARNNTEAFMKIVKHALSKDMTYFSINHPIDRCMSCGYEGIIGNMCPVCGISELENAFSRIRRVTGYLTGDYQTRFNFAKQAEVHDRVKHGE
jgi:anaerobic ribonucleoside-triphosphate reductase